MQKRNPINCSLTSTWLKGPILFVVIGISVSGCFSHTQMVYDREGIRIGVEGDPSISRTNQADVNNHPNDLTSKELESLLRVIGVSGYSGTIAGLFVKPQPVPLFTPKELSMISEHLATAFREAQPKERVFFSLPKPDVTYSEDRTAGSLFFRGRYLHVVVTDHSSIIRTDTGGGEPRDIRDTKGMKLWVAGPAQPAMVPDLEEPRWSHFERVHISLNVKQVLAQTGNLLPMNLERAETPASVSTVSSPRKDRTGASEEDLQLKVRELSNTNQELRGRLDEQNRRMQQLQDQVEQLRRELPKSDSTGQPYRKAPTP